MAMQPAGRTRSVCSSGRKAPESEEEGEHNTTALHILSRARCAPITKACMITISMSLFYI